MSDTAMELGTPGYYPALGLKVLISVGQPSHSVSPTNRQSRSWITIGMHGGGLEVRSAEGS